MVTSSDVTGVTPFFPTLAVAFFMFSIRRSRMSFFVAYSSMIGRLRSFSARVKAWTGTMTFDSTGDFRSDGNATIAVYRFTGSIHPGLGLITNFFCAQMAATVSSAAAGMSTATCRLSEMPTAIFRRMSESSSAGKVGFSEKGVVSKPTKPTKPTKPPSLPGSAPTSGASSIGGVLMISSTTGSQAWPLVR